MSFVDRLIGRLASPATALRRAVRLGEEGEAAEAFPLLTRSPRRAGIPDAEYRVARCYLEGSGVPGEPDGGRAMVATRRLPRLRRGPVSARRALLARVGRWGGRGLRTSRRRAGPLFASDASVGARLRVRQNSAHAGGGGRLASGQALLAYILTYGRRFHARSWRRPIDGSERSAASGCPQGHLGYALSLARRATDEDGRWQVADHLRRAADAGLPTAIYLLGVFTEHGIGIARDPNAAAGFFGVRPKRASVRATPMGPRTNRGARC